jgi:hypothetical protein
VRIVLAVSATTTLIHSAVAQERTIERKSPACVVQKDVDALYDFMRNQPSMQNLAVFLRSHQCLTLQSGVRVTIEQQDPNSLHYCVRMAERTPCYWIRRDALRR